MTALSTVANTFSVVGLADVVGRATVELYDLIKRTSSASKRAQELLAAVHDLTAVVAEVRLWVGAYEQSLFAQEDGQCVPSNIKTALEECLRQVTCLLQRLLSVAKAKIDWYQKITGRVTFALSEEQVNHSLRMLIYHQTAIKGLLLARGG